MLTVESEAQAGAAADHSVTLPFVLRQKSRLRADLDGGGEVAIYLSRGHVMRQGDLLLADDGSVVEVRAADETVSTVTASDALQLLRGAYHLGNRHVPLQVSDGFVRYQHDHVLDDMVRELGLSVKVEQAPFEPEGGAYGGGHSHGDGDDGDDGHDGEHGHDHGHDHGHGHHHHG